MTDLVQGLRDMKTELDKRAAEIERLRGIINGTCAVLKAPDLDNDGGVADLAEDVRVLLHNHTEEALEAERLRQIIADAPHERGLCPAYVDGKGCNCWKSRVAKGD